MQIRSYRNLYLLLLWFGLLVVAAAGQPSLPKFAQVFPTYSDLIPGWAYFKQPSQPNQAKTEVSQESKQPKSDVQILVNQERLQPFFASLHQLQQKKKSHVRVIHFGDSLIWADNVAFTIKENLQKEFGDGGRGLVTLIDSKESVLKGHTNLTKGGFDLFQIEHSSFNKEISPELGFTAKSVQPQIPGATTTQEAPATASPWAQVQLLLRSETESTGTIQFKTDGNQTVNVAYNVKPNQCLPISQDINNARKIEAKFDYTNTAPFIDGLVLETASGLSYSTVVRMGIHQAWMNMVSTDALRCGFEWFKPDLLIFEFGVNESASIETRFAGYTGEKYEAQLRQYYTRLRSVLPDTPILMIGPMDRVKLKDGALLPVPAQDEVRAIQKRVANDFNIAFFDTYEYLGGRGHIIQMVKQGLALNDYMHLSKAGGDMIANGVSNELLQAFATSTGTLVSTVANGAAPDVFDGEYPGAITFNSKAYAVFLFVVLIVASILVRWPKARLVFLVLASFYFYASWKFWPVLLIVASTALDYFCGLAIGKARQDSTTSDGSVNDRGTRFLVVSLVGNLGLLFIFKYLNFTGSLINRLIEAFGGGAPVPVFDLLLPVGISFYTFQTLSYTIDVWRGTLAVEKNVLRFALYVTFFPQLVAGPIVRAAEFLPDIGRKLRHFVVTHQAFSAGLFLIFTGLIKKVIADWLGVTIVDRVYASPSMFTSAEVLTAVYAYGIQIYGDFSGYTDIALGSAAMLGFHLTDNFNRPYQSASVTEYWRRWHISLGTWIRDYIYIGLGGNRTGVARNLLITMFAAGVWHGAGVNYAVWGFLHGVALVVERWIGWGKNPPKTKLTRFLRVFITFQLIQFGYIIFRLDDPAVMYAIVDRVFSDSWVIKNLEWRGVFLVMGFYIYHFTPIEWRNKASRYFQNLAWPIQSFVAATITVIAFQLTLPNVQPFIYFQF